MQESELLFSEILGCDRAALYFDKSIMFTKKESAQVASVLRRRMRGEPIDYILGKTEFMGLEFQVTPEVLIPRPETEILVETALLSVSGKRPAAGGVRILDVGTGSGCIAVSLAKLLPSARVDALDISGKALSVARENASLHGVTIEFIHGDAYTLYALRHTQYDMIVSNPPYIATGQIDTLQTEIQYEPRLALDGGSDGLAFYRAIAFSAPQLLKEKGMLILEVGSGQRNEVKKILQNHENLEIMNIVKDYSGIDRVIVAQKMKTHG